MKNLSTNLQRLMLALSFMVFVSCAELEAVLQEMPTSTSSPLTTQEVSKGLKEALRVGVDTAVSRLAKDNGYYAHPDVRILMPPEAQNMLDNIERIPGGKELADKLIRNINRSAEEAASEVVPLFVNAIMQMTIQDAWGILNGNQTAATDYLHAKTYDKLFDLYKPKIAKATNREWVASVSAQQAWDALTKKWNTFAGSMVGQLAGYEPVNIELDAYLTHEALKGLFLRIEEEESAIRSQAGARVTPLLERVFGRSS
jgi:hypothetical protein